ncbi:MAG: bifunctional diguanylate cyclase/phosphodiesterase [Candidatus Thiodiazotropha sp. (ex Myrtea spinifera)]|nr:bifunctional diguanylate cyclase/phosphodiesterase [Candidatus Thiodiazotropha sp. (ex Myrtea spinifera)]
MKIRFKPISISLFTAIFVAIFLLLLFFFGRVTYLEIEDLDSKFLAASTTRAEKEVQRALKLSIDRIKNQTKQLAKWEEVKQQLHNSMFYNYWYRHRAKANNLISEHTIDVAIYDLQGRMLSEVDTALLPNTIDTKALSDYILMNQFEPLLVIIEPVMDSKTESPQGFVATLSRVIPLFLSSGQFNQVDVDSLSVDISNSDRIASNELLPFIHYQLITDSYADTLRQVMTESVLRLAGMAAILSLIIFPIAARIMSWPILQISQHIDLLKKYNKNSVASSFQQPLLIKELDKIRQSLNDYHNQLSDVNITLSEKTKQLHDLAQHDPLTGARNRAAFDEYWHEINDVFQHSQGQISLLLFDIDHFKAINDTYGHEVGDEVLITVSQTLKNTLSGHERLFRLGGDEFITVLIGAHPRKAMQIAKQVHLAISRYPFEEMGIREPVRLSIGIAHTKPDSKASLASLQWQVNVATYQAKRPGHTNIVMFSEEMANSTQGLFSSRTHSAVYDAISQGTGLIMHYQPIVNLENGRSQYFEALVRIVHEGQLIMPSHIFPLVEAKGLEIDLDRQVIRKTLEDLNSGLIPVGTGVSINISAPSIVESDLFTWLEDFAPYMGEYKILLEITETAMITQMQKARSNLARLRSMGFRIALDDFGSGYSSLRYLGSMPVDVVKFDINLTRLIDSKNNNPILTHLAQMIVECGHLLVAEGIESASSAKQLGQLGFQYGQGYYFGRPSATIDEPVPNREYVDFSA